MMAAVLTVTGLALSASTFPATAATANRSLASRAASTSASSTGASSRTGTTVGSDTARGSDSAGDSTVATTGHTLSYNEGAQGYCTWWAIDQFHAYTGLYPNFFDPANNGNAEYWTTDAAYNGWTVTSTPRADSIAVFLPGVNGAESDGHVAWVTAVSGPHVTITEMNGPAGWNVVDTRTVTPAPSVTYILAP
jgi:surface antigen